jgi:hypothetical protein
MKLVIQENESFFFQDDDPTQSEASALACLVYPNGKRFDIIAFCCWAISFPLFVGTRSGSKSNDSKGQNSEPSLKSRVCGRAPSGYRLAREREPWGGGGGG